MRPNTLEALVPGLGAARENERQNRAIAFSGITWTVCGVEIQHLTPRHRLELQLAQNAFMFSVHPLEGDVFNFLWRLSPEHRRGGFNFRSMLKKAKLTRLTKQMRKNSALLRLAESQILKYMAVMYQDLPEAGDGSGSTNPPENYVHWMAGEAYFYLRQCRMNLGEYMDTPYLVLQQLYRCYRMELEDDPNFINASDRLVSAWQLQIRKSREEKPPQPA